MAFMNRAPYGAFPAPIGNPPMMNHQIRHNGPPRFNNTSPWRPQPERHNFNIHRFMHPPHMVQRPEFVPGNIFGQETSGAFQETFPFTCHQNNRGQQNTMGHQVNGQQNPQCHPFNGHQNPQGHPFSGHQNPQGHPFNGHQNPQGHPFNGQQNPQGHPFNGQQNPQGHPFNGHQGYHFNGQQNPQGPQVIGHQNPQGPFNDNQNSQGHPFNGHQNPQGHPFNSQQNPQGHPFNSQQNPQGHPFNGHQNPQGQQFNLNGQHFQGHLGRGRGFTRGHHGGQGFRRGYNNTQQNQTNKTEKKEKVDKRDLAENNAFFCDICDRGFKNSEKYKEHTDGHIKCTFKDCPFIGAPKLVQLHTIMQHRTGLAKKVWRMESEEDVKKWREDRKRNFPTSENVTKKLQERAEKIARGEVLETREFRKFGRGRGRNRYRGRGRGRWRDRNQTSRNEGERNTADSSDDSGPPEEMEIKKSTANDDDGPPEEMEIKKSTANDVEDSSMVGLEESSTDITETATTKLQMSEGIKAEGPSTANGNVPEASVPHMESAMDTSGNSLALLSSYGDSSDDGEESTKGKASFSASADVSANTVDPSTVSPSSSTHQKSTPTKPDPLTSSQFVMTLRENSLSPPKNEFSDTSIATSTNTTCSPHKVQPPTTAAAISADEQNSNYNSGCSNQEKHQDQPSNMATHTNDASSNQNLKENLAAGAKRGPQSRQKGEPQAKKNKKGPTKQQPCKYTLLQKLLAPDMRRERNKILQCVHYIVKNKFFEKEHSLNKAVPATDLSS